MIRVAPKPEYPGFDADVRKRGAAFLATCPNPTSHQFSQKNFWKHAARELHAVYSGICAYTSMYLPELGSVDHFLPKTTHPQLAYEWSNYRLASGRANSSKANKTDILDPFQIESSWFEMDVPSCMIKPNPNLERSLRNKVAATISSLRLNVDDTYVQERCNILVEYAQLDISANFLARRYPFLAKEVERQNLDVDTLRSMFRRL